MPPPGLQIYLRPRVTLIFDLLTPKVSPFVCERNVTFALMSSQICRQGLSAVTLLYTVLRQSNFSRIFLHRLTAEGLGQFVLNFGGGKIKGFQVIVQLERGYKKLA